MSQKYRRERRFIAQSPCRKEPASANRTAIGRGLSALHRTPCTRDRVPPAKSSWPQSIVFPFGDVPNPGRRRTVNSQTAVRRALCLRMAIRVPLGGSVRRSKLGTTRLIVRVNPSEPPPRRALPRHGRPRTGRRTNPSGRLGRVLGRRRRRVVLSRRGRRQPKRSSYQGGHCGPTAGDVIDLAHGTTPSPIGACTWPTKSDKLRSGEKRANRRHQSA